MVTPMLPFIAAAIVIGGLAALIYANWSGIVAWFGAAWQGIVAGWEQLKARAALWPEWWATLGGNIIDGLVNGLKAAFPVLSAIIGVAAKLIKGAFTTPMQIKSPSRLFAGYGHNLMAGLANGIAGNTGAPLARINNASRAITAALAIGAAAASPATAGAAGGSAGSGAAPAASVVQYVEIKIIPAPGQSPNDIAKAVAAELAKASNAAAARQRSSLGDYGE
jgi:hypothetical protein